MHWKPTLNTPLFLLFLGLSLTLPIAAQEGITYETAFPGLTFGFPVEIQHAADGTNRLFVVEQPGRIRVFSNDREVTAAKTFLDITNIVSFSSGQEIGLLGLAFHPRFSDNGYFYVYHTRQSKVADINVELVLARYRVSADDPDRADPASRLEIFSFDKNQRNSNHNGGKIAFGPDGYLYASLGDGGGGGDPRGNAQNLNTVFGSLFRIDVDIDGSNPLESNPDLPNGNYEIPADNPRVGRSGLDELYAWGLRNTWKFSFDNKTGRLWGGDVGQGIYEEVNLIERGGNYGWNRFEGNNTYRSSTSLVTTPDTKPVHTYDHGNGDVSITLGYVYRGRLSNPAIKDKLIFGDYVSGRVWALSYEAATGESSAQLLFRTDGQNVSSFGLDESGELYFSGYGSTAKLYRITDESDPEPTATAVDGVGSWEALAKGITGAVKAIVVDGNTVYATGSSDNNVSVYTEGQGWSSLPGSANGNVNALALDRDGLLYAGGDFTTIGGKTARNIAVWNGSSWSALAAGTNGAVLVMEVSDNNDLFVGGTFATAGGVTANNIAKWSGGSWSSLTDAGTGVSGTNNEVRSIALDENGLLYIGGNFASAGDRVANRIATFDGINWGTLGAGTSGFVQAIEITETYVYIGGNFSLAGNQTVNRIARWSRAGKQWQKIGEGVSGNVNALVYEGGYLYAGGNFATATTADGQVYIVNNVARWSPTGQWEALGEARDVGTDNQVNTLSLSTNADLYVGGSFALAGNSDAPGIARWRERGDCSLIPYTNINRQGWNRVNSVTIDAGDQVWFGPQSTKFRTAGSGWSWAGPNNFTASGRELLLNEVRVDRAGEYKVTNVDQNGCRASATFTISIEGVDSSGNAGSIQDGTVYEMQPQHDTNLRLDVRRASTANSALVDGYRRNGNANQQWKFIRRSGDVYEIEPQHAPGKRLDVARASKATNAEIHIYSRHGQDNQRWRALPVGDGTYRFEPLNAPGNRLDIEMVAGVPRALSRTLDNNDDSQRWQLIPLTTATDRTTGTANLRPAGGRKDLEGVFVLYPNPVSDRLTVESTLDYRFTLYDATGRLVFEGRRAAGTEQLDLSRLAGGSYVIRFMTADREEISKRVVIE